MRNARLILLIFIIINASFLHAQSSGSGSGTLEIKFTRIRNDKGLIAIGINNLPDGWPREPQMNANWKKVNINDGVFVARVENLPFGTYAISVLDDENSNLEMDMRLGIPKEGWGFSMNPSFRLSAPKYNECSFRLEKPFQQITINLRYAGKGK